MSSRQGATTSAYRSWFPFGKHFEQDAEKKRARKEAQKAENAAQTKVKSSSRAQFSQQPELVPIQSRGSPSAGAQQPLPQRAQSTPPEPPRDQSGVPSSSRYSRSQPQRPQAAAATMPAGAPPDLIHPPQGRSKRHRTPAEKIAAAAPAEQESSAEESIRKFIKTRRVSETVAQATSPTAPQTQAPVTSQSTNTKSRHVSSRDDPEREERHRRRREERKREERAKEDRAKEEQIRAEQESRARAKADAEPPSRTARATRPPTARREPVQEYDSSDSARRKPRVTSSQQRPALEEIIGAGNVRYDPANPTNVASSGQSALHIPFGIPKQPTASSQSTVRERVLSPSPTVLAIPRSSTPPPAPKLFPLHLPPGEQEKEAYIKEKEREREQDKDKERDKRSRDRHRERESTTKSSQHRSHRDKSTPNPTSQPSAPSNDLRSGSRDYSRPRGVVQSEAVRQGVYGGHESSHINPKMEANTTTTEVPKHLDNKALGGTTTSARDNTYASSKGPDRQRADTTPVSATQATSAHYPYSNGNPQYVFIQAAQGPPGQNMSSPQSETLSPTAIYIRSPTSHSNDRPGRHEVPYRSQSTAPEVSVSAYQSRTGTTTSAPHRNPPQRSETYPPPALEKSTPASAQLLSPLSPLAPQLTPSHSAASASQHPDYIRSQTTPVGAPPFAQPYSHSKAPQSQTPNPSPRGLAQPILIPRTPSNNSQLQAEAAVTAASQQPANDPYVASTKNASSHARPPNSQSVSYETPVYTPSVVQAPVSSSRQDPHAQNQYSYSTSRNLSTYSQSATYYDAPQSPLSHPIYVYESNSTAGQPAQTSRTSAPRPSEPPHRSSTAPAAPQGNLSYTAPQVTSRTPSTDKPPRVHGFAAANGADTSQMPSQGAYYRSNPADVPARTTLTPGPPVTAPPSRSTRTVPSPQSAAQSIPSRHTPVPGHARSQSQAVAQSQPIPIPLSRSTSHPLAPADPTAQYINGRVLPVPRGPAGDSNESLPQLTPSTSPDSMDEILLTPSSLAKTIKTSQPIVAPVTVLTPDEPKKRPGIIGTILRSASKITHPNPPRHDVWHPPHPPTPGPSGPAPRRTSGERQRSEPKPAPVQVPLTKVDSRASAKEKIAKPPPIVIPTNIGRRPEVKGHTIKLVSKRYRTVSTASMEALDGTANNTVVGSPTSSMRTSTPGFGPPSPPLRDPMWAAEEWRDNEEKDNAIRGTARRRRPGVTFDLQVKEATVEPQETPRPARLSRAHAEAH